MWLCLLCWLAPAQAAKSDLSTNSAAPAEKERLRSFDPPKAVDYRVPERSYVTTNLGGWTVHLEKELAVDYPDLAARGTERLDRKLRQVLGLLPSACRTQLQRLPIFLLLGDEAKAGGRDNGAEYFQRSAPEHWKWIDRRWGSGLVIYSARNYVWLNDSWAVRVLIHELAHAWQLEQWPEQQEDILGAWRHAVDTKLYLNAKAINGTVIPKPYAISNQLEYFAELSCAFFWKGEYEPLDREALQNYDPVGAAMVKKLWGVPPDTTSK
jgi:hypothetical protein